MTAIFFFNVKLRCHFKIYHFHLTRETYGTLPIVFSQAHLTHPQMEIPSLRVTRPLLTRLSVSTRA